MLTKELPYSKTSQKINLFWEIWSLVQKINLLNRNLRINKNQFKRAISSLREEKAARISQVDQAALIQKMALQRSL